jgi:hypothetical protein
MQSCKRTLISCPDVAQFLMREWWWCLTEEEYTACQRKLYDRSGHDTPSQKMYFNKLHWEVPKRIAARSLLADPERFAFP